MCGIEKTAEAIRKAIMFIMFETISITRSCRGREMAKIPNTT